MLENARFIEDVKAKGNFWFLHNIDKELYDILSSAEKVARTDFRQCGRLTREALELIVSGTIKRCNLESKIPSSMDLYEKIKSLRDEYFLRSVGYLAQDESLRDNPILPHLGKVRVVYENRSVNEMDYYDFLRRFGNACSHAEVRPTDVRVDYLHVCRCLRGYHSLLKKYYSNRISNDTPGFKEEFMPIERFYIEESYVPSDTHRSKCIREFVGYTLDYRGDKAFYAILRLYNKGDLNEKFLLRNTDTFVEASKFSVSSVPEGMTRVEELIPYDDNRSSFYIIAYIFNREPKRLTESLLKDLDMGKRIRMCKRIADCFYNLHRSEVPIYHRLLTYESIYVCDFGREWVPYVTKFDFAKIDIGDDLRTIFVDAVQAKERLQELKQKKYLAPEWNSITDTSRANWEKMDIYALGILFSDILVARLDANIVDIEELEELELTDDLLDLIDMMIADSPKYRCDIEEVQLVLDEEVRLWR